jgi:hypothetical protein
MYTTWTQGAHPRKGLCCRRGRGRDRGEDGTPTRPVFDVVVRHLHVGHRFPTDDAAWARAAVALASAGEPALALAAVARGAAVQPRHADLLRVQALALADLGLFTLADAARAAWVAHKPADAGPAWRGACSRTVPGCANERNPVHLHELHPLDTTRPPR